MSFGLRSHAVLYGDVNVLDERAASILDQPSIWRQVRPKCYVPTTETASNNLAHLETLWLKFRKCQASCQSLTNLTGTPLNTKQPKLNKQLTIYPFMSQKLHG